MLTMPGTGNTLVTGSYNTCFIIDGKEPWEDAFAMDKEGKLHKRLKKAYYLRLAFTT